MTVCTRFAPSPTGYLHIGGARTALYSWLYARQQKGRFILRIEDTDRERSTDEAIDAIFQGMKWLGLEADAQPVFQTQRFDRYREVADQLLAEGHAYRCYCTKERLEALREARIKMKRKPRYDGHCRDRDDHPSDAPFVVRFRNPLEGEVVVSDLIRGPVTFQNEELDDLIIARSDGTPTYNFTVVVDDWDMHVTHVIRGDDHLNNTPRQMNILQALGATPPIYAHVPMILGEDGKRLSKRHGAVSVLQYRDEGYMPEALLNYLVRLGWSHGDQEVFHCDELIELFDLKQVSRSAAVFNPKKLLWLNEVHIKESAPAKVAEQLQWHFDSLGIDASAGPSLVDLVIAQRERAKTLKEMAESSRFFYEEFEKYDAKAARKNLTDAAWPALTALREALAALDDNGWASDERLHETVEKAAERLALGFGKLAQPLRVAVTGGSVSPSINVTLRLLGKTKVLARLDRAIASIAS